MNVTIVGAKGFIGSKLSHFLKSKNIEVLEIDKGYIIDQSIDYGVVFYCAGVTTDYQNRSSLEAHVFYLDEWIRKAFYSKIIYLSSTRIYQNLKEGKEDSAYFMIDNFNFYNQTKLMGESLLMLSDKPYVIVRISNVLAFNPYSEILLWKMMRQAKESGKLVFEESKDCVRDYIALSDVLEGFYRLFLKKELVGIFNICSGYAMSNQETVQIISNYKLLDQVLYGSKSFLETKLINEKIKSECNMIFLNPIEEFNNICQMYF